MYFPDQLPSPTNKHKGPRINISLHSRLPFKLQPFEHIKFRTPLTDKHSLGGVAFADVLVAFLVVCGVQFLRNNMTYSKMKAQKCHLLTFEMPPSSSVNLSFVLVD